MPTWWTDSDEDCLVRRTGAERAGGAEGLNGTATQDPGGGARAQ